MLQGLLQELLQPHPQLFPPKMLPKPPLPEKQEMRRIQIIHSQEPPPKPVVRPLPQLLPQPLPPRRPPQPPFPPKQESRRMIQMMLQLLPEPNKEELLLQPQPQLFEQSFIIFFLQRKFLCYILCEKRKVVTLNIVKTLD